MSLGGYESLVPDFLGVETTTNIDLNMIGLCPSPVLARTGIASLFLLHYTPQDSMPCSIGKFDSCLFVQTMEAENRESAT